MSLILFLIIGAIAGWIAGKLMRGGGFGLVGNLVVGIVGAVIGGHLFSYLGVSAGGGVIGSLLTAVIGAVVLLFIVGLIKKA
ncbi:GlsB/YeaQ/YmgE family stress response membrane protein [Pseudomonas sp. 2FG]|uniref:GlsB/YeaQ/YmgE family stress response membrane protein n=1 Tax=Pseudomonas sp. 2FG TaxID=2502191 RepID=UPI0010F8EC99|nr:GlsB/YeaQ/YmgE family stress response membrane protein [Pseudomonas sp. 2FG]